MISGFFPSKFVFPHFPPLTHSDFRSYFPCDFSYIFFKFFSRTIVLGSEFSPNENNSILIYISVVKFFSVVHGAGTEFCAVDYLACGGGVTALYKCFHFCILKKKKYNASTSTYFFLYCLCFIEPHSLQTCFIILCSIIIIKNIRILPSTD
jgi:hypothetical protein